MPIPPLDGSRVLAGMVPAGAARAVDALERYGFVLLLLLVFSGTLDVTLYPLLRGAGALLLVWASCVGLHVLSMIVASAGAVAAGFSWRDRIAVTFAASQKTLPIGVSIANIFVGYGLPFAVFPMLMYHASQLFIDTAVADRMAAAAQPPDDAPAQFEGQPEIP